MSEVKCNYQVKAARVDLNHALSEVLCAGCGASVSELRARGEKLEACGEEFCSDIVTGDRVLRPIALCPACHRENHLDARQRHHPCQVSARLSREHLL